MQNQICGVGVVVSLSAVTFGPSARADTLNVPSRFSTIQAAIDAATNSDEVVIADGIYTGTGNKNLDFGGKLITVRSANGAANCVINCENDGRAFRFHTAETSAAKVQGLTIKNGRPNRILAGGPSGGAISIDGSSPSIEDCVFDSNEAPTEQSPGFGGGMFATNTQANVINCVFVNNTAQQGGGLAFLGGTLTLTDCQFLSNVADEIGGGIVGFPKQSVALQLDSCTFSGNIAPSGSGVYSDAPLHLRGNIQTNGTDRIVANDKFNVGFVSPDFIGSCTLDDSFQFSNSAYAGVIVNGKLHIDLGGTTANQYDRLLVGQGAGLGGLLEIALVNSFVPGSGDQFEIIETESVTKEFDAAFFPTLPDGLVMAVDYTGGALAGKPTHVVVGVKAINSKVDFTLDSLAIDGTPTSIVTADLDGINGDDMLITISNGPSTPGSLLVLLNDGTGGALAGSGFDPTTYPAGHDPRALATGHFTADDTLDVALVNAGSDDVRVFSNDGLGGFTQLGSPIVVGDEPVDLAAANFDGESQDPGEIDMAVVNHGSGSITILRNTGSGSFELIDDVPAGKAPSVIDPGDYDNNRVAGYVDFAVIEEGAKVVRVYRNLAGNGFDAPEFLDVSPGVVDLASADLNGDGLTEILTVNQGNAQADPPIGPSISILRNISNGSMAFAPGVFSALDSVPVAIAIANIDYDGDADLAIAFDNQVQTLRNDTSESSPGSTVVLTWIPEFAVASGTMAIASGDLDSQFGSDLIAVADGGVAASKGVAGSSSASLLFNATSVLCAGDVTPNGGNSVVDVDDLLAVINQWGACDFETCTADIAPIGGNGVIDVDDLLAVINNWGSCN